MSRLDTNKDTTFMRRVWLEEAYQRFAASKLSRQCRRQQQPLDLACEDVLTTIRECLSTVHGPTVSKVLEEHQNRDEKLTRLLCKVVKHLEDRIQRSSGDGDEVDATLTLWKHMLQHVWNVNSTSRSTRDFAGIEEKYSYLKQRRETLIPELIPALEDWVRNRVFDRL